MTRAKLYAMLEQHTTAEDEIFLLIGDLRAPADGLTWGDAGMSIRGGDGFRPDAKKVRASRSEAESVFTLAGFVIHRMWELPNGYWPDAYVKTRAESPWWLVQTGHGLIEFGWRKSVMHIEWGATPVRAVITEDDVTKSETYVHAHSPAKAVKYLTALRKAAEGL